MQKSCPETIYKLKRKGQKSISKENIYEAQNCATNVNDRFNEDKFHELALEKCPIFKDNY